MSGLKTKTAQGSNGSPENSSSAAAVDIDVKASASMESTKSCGWGSLSASTSATDGCQVLVKGCQKWLKLGLRFCGCCHSEEMVLFFCVLVGALEEPVGGACGRLAA